MSDLVHDIGLLAHGLQAADLGGLLLSLLLGLLGLLGLVQLELLDLLVLLQLLQLLQLGRGESGLLCQQGDVSDGLCIGVICAGNVGQQ